MSSHSATASATASLTRISPPSASAATRAACATLRPKMSLSRCTTSPWWMPIRISTVALPLRRPRSKARCIAMALRTACSGAPYAAMNPSPWVLTTCPLVPRDRRADRGVVPGQQPDPLLVAEPLVELGGALDVARTGSPRCRPRRPAASASGRSTWAQPARSSIELRIAPPKPFSRTRSTVSHTAFTASSGVGTSRRGGRFGLLARGGQLGAQPALGAHVRSATASRPRPAAPTPRPPRR